MKLRRLAGNPAAVVLAGRATAQAGFFLFTVAPSLVLADDDFNHLVVGVTVLFLTVVAPVGAFQQHLLRQPEATTSTRDALRKSLLLASVCSVIGLVLTAAFVGFSTAVLLLALGSVANVVSTLGASYHALSGRFWRSAALDAVSGCTFAVLSVALVVQDGSVVAWSAGFLAVWLLSAALTVVGPLRLPRTSTVTTLGPIWLTVRSGSRLLAIGVMSMAFNRADYLALTLVASDVQASRYALAGRFVGPIMIALSSLNNSLYVRQIALKDDPTELRRLTASAAKKVGALAILVTPCIVGGVWLLGLLSDSFESRHLLLPSAILAIAAVPFAFAIPFSFALTAVGRERVWLYILFGATVADLVTVLIVGSHGATPTALAWLATQTVVWFVLTRASGLTTARRRVTATAST